MKPTAYCVSLGPGDPELLTVKALRILSSSEVIFCPGTDRGSRAKKLLSFYHIPEDKLSLFSVPMKEDRTEALKSYTKTAGKIESLVSEGKMVSFVAEGDGGFYSSQHYIADFLESTGYVSVEYIPGIPAFIAGGARSGLHIAKGDDGLVVLPVVKDSGEIIDHLEKHFSVVLMKPSRSEVAIKESLMSDAVKEVHYLENIGLNDKEFVSRDRVEICSRPFPYFSILIITPV